MLECLWYTELTFCRKYLRDWFVHNRETARGRLSWSTRVMRMFCLRCEGGSSCIYSGETPLASSEVEQTTVIAKKLLISESAAFSANLWMKYYVIIRQFAKFFVVNLCIVWLTIKIFKVRENNSFQNEDHSTSVGSFVSHWPFCQCRMVG